MITGENKGPVILAAFANDRSDHSRFLRNLSEEAKRIQSVLEPAHRLCPLVLLPNATLDEILDAFQKYRDRIVVFHYAGHANGFQLLLESVTGGVHRIGAKGLAAFLGQQQGLQLVFLNGCSTERQTDDLLNAGVGCVIATIQAIDDSVATDFASRFYKGIVTGAALQAAYAEAVGSAQAASGGAMDRLLIPLEEEETEPVAGRWPWLLRLRQGAERVAQWSLPDAAGDPLFGLPPVQPRALPESPYRHLYRFEAEHAEVFFGRGYEIRDLYQRVTAPDSPPVILFYGPAGVGKSSLLDAGIIPRLSHQSAVKYVRRNAARGLGESLRQAFPKELRSLNRREAWIAAEQQLGRPLVIVLDQVEETFTKPNAELPQELAEFAQLLRRIFAAPNQRPQGRLILGFRKEWFAEIDERLAEAQVPRARLFLDRLSRRGVIEAITSPAEKPLLVDRYHLSVEPGLSDIIADDLLADPDTPVAPTLQILLTRMWTEACGKNREAPKFDLELYQSLRRKGILLDDFLRQQTDLISAELPLAVASGFLLDLLEFHTTAIGTSAEHPFRLLEQTYAEQAQSGLLKQTLSLCEEFYLLTFSRGSEGEEGRTARLLHDTLAPLVRARHEESDFPGQRARRILDNRSSDWQDGHVGAPLDAADLKEVEGGLIGTRRLSPDEQRLVTASREQRDANRRWSQIIKGLGLAAVILIAVSSAGAYFYFGKAETAERQRQTAETAAKAAKIKADQEEARAQTAGAKADAAEQRRVEQEAAASTAKVAADEAREETEKQVARGRFEQAKIERRLAVVARDTFGEPIASAHHFAAAAAFSDDPVQAANMAFAADRSLCGLRLIDLLEHEDFVHEAWVLKSGEVLTWSGTTLLRRWKPDGTVFDIPHKEPFGRVILSEDEQLVYAEGKGITTFDLMTGNEQASPPDLNLDHFALPVLYRPDRTVLEEQLGKFDLQFIEQVMGPIYSASLSADKSKVLAWTAHYVQRPQFQVDAVDNPAGMVRVWDRLARVPITPPLKLTLPLRGAKFANNDREMLMWGEDGRVLRWDLQRADTVQILAKQTAAPEFKPSSRSLKFRAVPDTDDKTSRDQKPGEYEVTWDYAGWRIADLSGSEHPVRGLSGMRLDFQKGFRLLGWGGDNGAPGSTQGGFVMQWSVPSGQRMVPTLRHPLAVAGANYNERLTRLVSATMRYDPGIAQPATVHLWDLSPGDEETRVELMQALPVFDYGAEPPSFSPDGNALIIHMSPKMRDGQEETQQLTFSYGIAEDPTLDPQDPRIDLILRTGASLSQSGQLQWMRRSFWKELLANETKLRTVQGLERHHLYEKIVSQRASDQKPLPRAQP